MYTCVLHSSGLHSSSVKAFDNRGWTGRLCSSFPPVRCSWGELLGGTGGAVQRTATQRLKYQGTDQLGVVVSALENNIKLTKYTDSNKPTVCFCAVYAIKPVHSA